MIPFPVDFRPLGPICAHGPKWVQFLLRWIPLNLFPADTKKPATAFVDPSHSNPQVPYVVSTDSLNLATPLVWILLQWVIMLCTAVSCDVFYDAQRSRAGKTLCTYIPGHVWKHNFGWCRARWPEILWQASGNIMPGHLV